MLYPIKEEALTILIEGHIRLLHIRDRIKKMFWPMICKQIFQENNYKPYISMVTFLNFNLFLENERLKEPQALFQITMTLKN